MAEADQQLSIITLDYRQEAATRKFYEAVSGGPLSSAELLGRAGFIVKIGEKRLFLRKAGAAEPIALKEVFVPLEQPTAALSRLAECGLEACVGNGAILCDPDGHHLKIVRSYGRLLCKDAAATEQFYRIIGVWIFASTSEPGALLLSGDELLRLEQGTDDVRVPFHITVRGPMLSTIDRLNTAGFGPFPLTSTVLTDPDGRLVQLIRAS